MKTLQDLGFLDTSYNDDENNFFQEFTLEKKDLTLMVSGVFFVEIFINNNWATVPNCKTIEDLECLIKLFSK